MVKTEQTKTTVDGWEYVWERTGELRWETQTECGRIVLSNRALGMKDSIAGNWCYTVKGNIYPLKSASVRDAMKEAIADLMN